MADQKKEAQLQKELRTNEKKWSKELMAPGFTVIPNVIVTRMQALGLDAMDLAIIVYLSTYWWTPEGLPRPSKKTMASALGCDPSTIRKRIQKLEAGGLLQRIERREGLSGSKPNEYSFAGLIEAATPYAQEEVQERETKLAARNAKAKRKGRPKLKVVKNKDE
ncbi:helix-turn-helix domain-containing protein [Palleronia sp. LCG004]|uniref:helix-turn-helix domain-containing protein n=1 Tax=Palleronia sp. LCG004 TaxID=3079304 RepID=UPI0029427109|nr:helix-turn-helix domain-containing protein [Palleronia sp. LCG004]WOI57492.1 helix-turn-helix domain-containing protein [Palleronia sp. LCG004]